MTQFGLSVAAFVLAILANIWTFALTWVRWPRVSVEMRAYVYISPRPARLVIGGDEPGPEPEPEPEPEPSGKMVVTVINRGSEAITVSGIGLEARGYSARDFEYDEVHYPELLPTSPHDPLPLRLEGHGALRWIYGPDQLRSFPNGTMVTAYAKVYRTFRRGKAITERKICAPVGRLRQ
jgi:hypothetical protein